MQQCLNSRKERKIKQKVASVINPKHNCSNGNLINTRINQKLTQTVNTVSNKILVHTADRKSEQDANTGQRYIVPKCQ